MSNRLARLRALGIESWALRSAPEVAAPSVPRDFHSIVALKGDPQIAEPQVVAAPLATGWDALREQVAACRACRLCETRTQTVFGTGALQAPLMVVGEGPGADEDAQGDPFVGRAGKLLDEMLRSIGRSRLEPEPDKAVYIANVVKCRPPGNREPAEDEAESCRPFLEAQLRLVKPKLIVALGRVAAQRLLVTDEPLARLRGPLHRWGPEGTPLFVTYHPAYLLRSPGEKAKSWEDLKRIHQFLVSASA
ncbi:MAG TPA: uracil-DNA glycosylase [Nevskiaceae bacterium]|nr:uracil-DNA glycosylase [Nevskiaceae bacterium]